MVIFNEIRKPLQFQKKLIVFQLFALIFRLKAFNFFFVLKKNNNIPRIVEFFNSTNIILFILNVFYTEAALSAKLVPTKAYNYLSVVNYSTYIHNTTLKKSILKYYT